MAELTSLRNIGKELEKKLKSVDITTAEELKEIVCISGVITLKNKFSSYKTMNILKEIFNKHKDERICVVGTMCYGKTTLVRQLKECNCIDSDDEFWPMASEEEYEFYSQRPFTKEMSDSLHMLFCKRIFVKPGTPLFGVYILDCEVVVHLDIDDNLLSNYCKRRGDTNFFDAYNCRTAQYVMA